MTEQQTAERSAKPEQSEAGDGQQRGQRWREQQDSTRGRTDGQHKRTQVGDSDRGHTHIADVVVAKIVALASREVPGVHSMGKTLTRKLGVIKAKLPGTDDDESLTLTQGVSVEVGETEAAIDLDLVVHYGHSIIDVTGAVRENVIDRVEGMTGLSVVEVNITVDDLHVEDEGDAVPLGGGSNSTRVQ